MSTTFKINESYKHKCAKEIFKQWCQERPRDGCGDVTPWITNFDNVLCWRNNRTQEAWLEYPIVVNYKTNSAVHVWDEIWPGPDRKENYVPTYTECIEKDLIPIAVIDVVIPHKNTLYYCVEICHTNPVSDEKIKKLQQAGVRVLIEIDAEWILRQIKIPSKLQIKRWLIYNNKIGAP